MPNRTFNIEVHESTSALDGGKMWTWQSGEHRGVVRQSGDLALDDHRIESEFIRAYTDRGSHSIHEVASAKFVIKRRE
jgi:hypothetical protein